MHSQQPDTHKPRRRVFLRLYEDVSELLNEAVQQRVKQGTTLAAIARKMGVDRAFLTRVLQGQAGTSLRTIAKVLFATDYRLRLVLVPCDSLRGFSNLRKKMETEWASSLHWQINADEGDQSRPENTYVIDKPIIHAHMSVG